MRKVAIPDITATSLNDIWKQYEILVELHKYYFKLVLSGCTFINGVIGALIIYSLDKKLPLAITFPIGIAVSFSIFLCLAIPMAKELKEALEKIVEKLGVGLAPHAQLLVYALRIFMIIYLLVSLSLIFLIRWEIKKFLIHL